MLIRVAVVDNHQLFRDAVVAVVGASPEFEVIAQGACGSDAVSIARDECPDILLMDVKMSDCGIEAAREITAISPSVKTVMLTSCDGPEYGAAARAAGACTSIVKGLGAAELMATLRAVYMGT